MKTRLKDFLANVLFAACLGMALYSWKNYYVTDRVVLPALIAVSPKHEQKTADIIASMLPSDGSGPVARELLNSRVGELTQLHQAWLDQATAYRAFARNQLILSALAGTGAFGLIVILYREARGAR